MSSDGEVKLNKETRRVIEKAEQALRREEFITKLYIVSDEFAKKLAWTDKEILMTPATEFYRLFSREIEKLEQENMELRTIIKNIDDAVTSVKNNNYGEEAQNDK